MGPPAEGSLHQRASRSRSQMSRAAACSCASSPPAPSARSQLAALGFLPATISTGGMSRVSNLASTWLSSKRALNAVLYSNNSHRVKGTACCRATTPMASPRSAGDEEEADEQPEKVGAPVNTGPTNISAAEAIPVPAEAQSIVFEKQSGEKPLRVAVLVGHLSFVHVPESAQ